MTDWDPSDELLGMPAQVRRPLNAFFVALQTRLETIEAGGAAGGLQEVISGQIELAADQDYVLDQDAAYAYRIISLVIQAGEGGCTVAVKIGSTPVTGISAVSVSTTEATANSSAARDVAVGDRVVMTISANSSAVRVSFTLKTTRL